MSINKTVIVRSTLASMVVVAGLLLAWFFTVAQTTHAAGGLIETPTQTNPWGVALDGQGHIWVAEPGCDVSPKCATSFPTFIGEYSTSNDTLIKNYAEPANFSSPVFLALGKTGRIWFTETNSNAIGVLVPGSTPTWKQWTVPSVNAIPYDLVMDKNGNIWFSEFGANKIGFFNTVTHTFVETAIPSSGSSPYGITMAPNGNIWFCENALAKIGSFTPTKTGTITIKEHTISTVSPHLITADKTGNIWYSQGFSGIVGEFMPKTGTHTEFQVSKNICPTQPCSGTHISGIAVDGNGMVWFTDSLSHRVGYVNPANGTVKALTLASSSSHPHDGLAADSSNNMWFTELFDSKLGEVLAGTI